jgi:UDP-4-amino-4,6-dideoxy-N-acetyl-beta-L-altrosamine transaminase
MEILPYGRQFIDEEDIQAVVEALRSPFLTTGPIAEEFERKLAEYVGARYAVACSNGTTALHIALLTLGLTEKDTILTTPNTFIADANAARFIGADVVFADIDPHTANLCPKSARKVLEQNKNIKVIIPVHFAGQPIEAEEFQKLSKEFGVSILEDGCHALGSSFTDSKGKVHKVGGNAYCDLTTFSFHPVKNITTGEGGAILTNDETTYKLLRRYRSHGTTKEPDEIQLKEQAFTEIDGQQVYNPWYYEMHQLANNYRISDFQCALGMSQLKKLDRFVERRNKLVDLYHKAIDETSNGKVTPLFQKVGIVNAYHLFVVRIQMSSLKGGRANLMNKLRARGINTQVHYIPLYHQPYYRNYFGELLHFENTEKYYEEALSLPLFTALTDEHPSMIINTLNEIIEELWTK